MGYLHKIIGTTDLPITYIEPKNIGVTRGNRDLVEDGRTGVLVVLGDVPGLARAFERLTSAPELRAALGATGREKIQDYSLEKVLTEMAGIYDRYLK